MDCAYCGLAPCDLPDGVDPEAVFDQADTGEWICHGCLGLTTGVVIPCSPW